MNILPRNNCLILVTTVTFAVFFITPAVSSKSRYILPVLPETYYTLNDVIVVPENTGIVEVTITSMTTSIAIVSLNLTAKHEFRLGYGVATQQLSLESGLYLITSCQTTVIIDLPGCLFKLPSFSDIGHMFHIILNTGDSRETIRKPFLIQSESPSSSVRICGIYDIDHTMLEHIAFENNERLNCTTVTTSDIGRYILNETAMFSEIQITSAHPINIFQGQATHLSDPLVQNKQTKNKKPTSSNSPTSVVRWHAIPALSNLSTSAFLAPSAFKREYTFSTVCHFDNCSVDFQSGDDLATVDISKHEPINTNITIPPGGVFSMTMTPGLTMDCIKSDRTSCNDELFSISVEKINYSISGIDGDRIKYKWIFISNKTSSFILFPSSTDVRVKSLNENITSVDSVQMNISNSLLTLSSLSHLSDGIYMISTNGTTDSISHFYLPKKQVAKTNITDDRRISAYNKIIRPSSRKQTITGLIKTNGISITKDTVIADNSSRNDSFVTTGKTLQDLRLVNDTTLRKNLTFRPSDEKFETGSSENSISRGNKLFTTLGPSEDFKQKDLRENIITDGSDSNSRFKAVVDIFHYNEGRKDLLIHKSKAHEDPTYTYRFNVNSYYGQEGESKNPVAIIVSLVSAILAVGAIILIFLLKDLFSQRQLIRNTRIRPIISYY